MRTLADFFSVLLAADFLQEPLAAGVCLADALAEALAAGVCFADSFDFGVGFALIFLTELFRGSLALGVFFWGVSFWGVAFYSSRDC